MKKVHKLDDVLIGYWKSFAETKNYSIYDSPTNNNFKMVDEIIVPPSMLADGRLTEVTLTFVHDKAKCDLIDFDFLFDRFDTFDLPKYNGIQIYLKPVNYEEWFTGKDQNNNDVYEIRCQIALTQV